MEYSPFQKYIILDTPQKLNPLETTCELQVFPAPGNKRRFRQIIALGKSAEESEVYIEEQLMLGQKVSISVVGQTKGDILRIIYQSEISTSATSKSPRRFVTHSYVHFFAFTEEMGWQEKLQKNNSIHME